MDHTDQWLQSPSGSRAEDTWTTTDAFPQNDDAFYGVNSPADDDEDFVLATNSTFGGSDLRPGELMSAKIPPAFNGKSSWFAYEEILYDWQHIIIL